MKNNLVAVIIPIYKTTMNEYENISFLQCTKVLRNYPIIIVAPQGLNISHYQNIYSEIKVVYFDKEYFESPITYSLLLLKSEFYQKFQDYQFILIHQLDAFVFRDELELWCEKNYDYIGAPWLTVEHSSRMLQHYKDATNSKYIFLRWLKRTFNFNKKRKLLVGNGGFSLRKVKSSVKICKHISYLINLKEFTHNEDIIWSIYVPTFFPFFKIPNEKIALKFSFETSPKDAYYQNNSQLPFGCHAWELYDIDFWRPFFLTNGYLI